MTRNIQNTSNNRGIGEIGNQSNIQVGSGGKEDHTPPLPRKKKDFMVIAISMSCIFSIASVLYLMFCGVNSRGGESLLLSSLVISIIGVIATVVVIGNYAQVRDIETKFRQEVSQIKDDYLSQKKEVENMINKVEDGCKNRIEDVERRVEVIDAFLEPTILDRMGELLFKKEASKVMRAFHIDESLFDDESHKYSPDKSAAASLEYKNRFEVELSRSFATLKKIVTLRDDYDFGVPPDTHIDPGLKEEMRRIVGYVKRILQHIKYYSLEINLSDEDASDYSDTLRRIRYISSNDMALMIQILQSLSLPPDADRPANTSS